MTDINKAKAAKVALQERIQLALREFTEETSLAVERVKLERFSTMAGRVNYVVDAEVRL